MFYTALTSGLGLAEAVFEARQGLDQAGDQTGQFLCSRRLGEDSAPLLDVVATQSGPLDPNLIHRGTATDLPAPTGVFVGRQRELRALRIMLESTPGSGPALALITGPAGIGKSTLAAQAVTRYGGQYKAALTLSCADYQGADLFLKQIGEFLERQDAPKLLERILPDTKLSKKAKFQDAIKELNRVGPFLLLVDNLETVQREKDLTLTDPYLLLLLQTLMTNLQGGRLLIIGRYTVANLLPNGKFASNQVYLSLNDLSDREACSYSNVTPRWRI